MRKELGAIGEDDRHVFTAEFVRFGIKSGWNGDVPTCLFKNIRLGEKVVCDHLWFTCGKQFDKLGMQIGDIVEFSARVSPYVKGYMGRREDVWDNPLEEDWKLSFPTKVRKIGRNENPDVPKPPRPRNISEQGNASSIEHSERVEMALRRMRVAPPNFQAVFVDGRGKEIAKVCSEDEICRYIGITYAQWKCFFRGLVGTPGKGDEIQLRFVRRRKGKAIPPYYLFGAINEKQKRYGDWKFEGYGFLMARYILGWKKYTPSYIAEHREELNGKETGKGRVHLVPLGDLQKWDMAVTGDGWWKKKFEERMEKINKTDKEGDKTDEQK